MAIMFFALGMLSTAYAGVKVDIVFKNPGWTYNGVSTTTCEDGGPGYPSSCVNLPGRMTIWYVNKGESKLLTNGNKSVKFKGVQSGSGPKLFRFEWRWEELGRPFQVIDSWIDVPNTTTWNQTLIYNIPAHNVVFTSDVGNRDIGFMSSSFIGDRRDRSIINKKSDPVLLLKGNLTGGLTPKNVPMLDGCYTVYYYDDNTCPGNSCSRNYLEYPVCVGGAPGAVNEVHLENDDMPTVFPTP